MSVRYITGNLAKDPEIRKAGRVEIVQLTVLENTATYRGDERVPSLAPLNHWVEAKFELGANVAASLHEGDAVVVVGHERDASFEGKDGIQFRRVIDATHVGADLSRATAVVTRTPRKEPRQAPRFAQASDEGHEAPAEPQPQTDTATSLWGQS